MPDSDRSSPYRKPFGERDDDDRAAPFGSRPPGERRSPRPPLKPVSPQDIIEVPLVRISALDEEDLLEEAADSYDTVTFDDDLDPPINDEPDRTPAVVRVRDRRGTIPPDESILKTAPQKTRESGAAALGSRVPVIRFGVLARTLGLIVLSAAIVATLFTWWTPTTFMPTGAVDQLSVALATQSSGVSTTPLPTDPPPPPTEELAAMSFNNIGIVSGHMGIYPETGVDDPGAVCADGLTEAEVNENIATLVVEWLSEHGYTVDLLEEFDPRLQGYSGLALISIHADSCEYINDAATGFKVASFAESSTPEEDTRLVRCLIDRYADTTDMTFHPSVTYDMTQYHTFHEITPGTPGVIIEVGFMYMDREMLTDHADVVALGIARGLLCYLRDEPIDEGVLEPTPVP